MSENVTTASVQGDVAVQVDDATHVATIEILRGPNNFFDVDVLARLADVCEELASGSTRAIVLCSEGKNFCAGANFGSSQPSGAGNGKPHIYDVGIRLFEQPLPIVAAVQGSAVGGGLGLALATDFRVASPESRFTANFSLLGFHPGFGLSVTLPKVVGEQAALDLFYTGRRIDGTTAYELGLVDHLVEAESIRSHAVAVATEIALAAPLALRSIRKTMRGDLANQARKVMAHERAEQERLMATTDFREGVAAVSERRAGKFSGQ